MKTLGIYYPINPIYSKRDGRVQNASIDLEYRGLSKIKKDIDSSRFFVKNIVTEKDFKNVDIVLYSLISFYDIQHLFYLNKIKKDFGFSLFVGGPACNNIRGYIDFIDGACFGRCDAGLINDILAGKNVRNFWRKEVDQDFSKRYTIGSAKINSMIHKSLDLFGEEIIEIEESSVGCPLKCSFCLYSHWNDFVSVDDSINYKSGFAPHEDFFQNFDWRNAARGVVTALDGGCEKTRLKVNKRITATQIKEKILSVKKSSYCGVHRVKVYNIYGYPWEDPLDYKIDLFRIAERLDCFVNKKIIFKLQQSHFIPFAKTPLSRAPFNRKKFHLVVKDFVFKGKNIEVYPGTHNQSPRLSLLSTIIQRATRQLPPVFFEKKTWTKSCDDLLKEKIDYVDLKEINYDVLWNVGGYS